jgi:anti-anti-sigma factor
MRTDSDKLFEIRERRGPDALTMYLYGEFDYGSREVFESAFSERLREKAPLILDLTELAFIDSTSIRALFKAKSDSDQGGVELAVRLPDEGQVHDILSIAGVRDVFPPPAPASTTTSS